jgi:predicted dehydrogenase
MRLTIIGCGLIGSKRAVAAAAHEIVAVCDPDPERRERLAHQASSRAIADWREAVSLDTDAVVIATPHDQLAQIALAAVEAGRHVLVEKPAGRRPEEVAPLVAAAAKRGRIVKVGFNHRFHPAIARAKAIADDGGIGPLFFIRGRYGHGGRE